MSINLFFIMIGGKQKKLEVKQFNHVPNVIIILWSSMHSGCLPVKISEFKTENRGTYILDPSEFFICKNCNFSFVKLYV